MQLVSPKARTRGAPPPAIQAAYPCCAGGFVDKHFPPVDESRWLARPPVSMLDQPSTDLGDHEGLAGDGQLLGPCAIDPQPETSPIAKRQIHQLHFELLAAQVVLQVQTVVRFGPWHAPLYAHKALLVSKIRRSPVHWEMHLPVHESSSTTS